MTEPTPPEPPVKAKKDDKRKQTIIAIAAVVGVLLTYLLYRRSAGSSTTTTSATPSTSDTTGSTDSPTEDAGLAQISSQLSDLSSTLTTALTPATPQLGATTPAAPIASTLFAPDASNALGYEQVGAHGTLAEIEADGSLLGLTLAQWTGIEKANPAAAGEVNHVAGFNAPVYSTSGNVSDAPVNATGSLSQGVSGTVVPQATSQIRGVDAADSTSALLQQVQQHAASVGTPSLVTVHTGVPS